MDTYEYLTEMQERFTEWARKNLDLPCGENAIKKFPLYFSAFVHGAGFEHDIARIEPTLREPLMKGNELHQFMIKGFRCGCGCNVFHKPDKTNLLLYKCNACGLEYEGEVV